MSLGLNVVLANFNVSAIVIKVSFRAVQRSVLRFQQMSHPTVPFMAILK